MTAWKWLAAAIGLLVLAGAGLAAWGAARWNTGARELIAGLDAARTPVSPGTPTRYDARELEGLPAPVQRYFRAVLKDGQRVPFTGEVAWMLPEGRQTYWRGSITTLAYEFAP